MKKKVYIETTIPSFYYNQRTEPELVAMMHWTRDWWDSHRILCDPVSSAAVIDELMQGDHPLKSEKLALLHNIPLYDPSDEIAEIVSVYIAHKVMPRHPSSDALHLALASFHSCDILLTWNCIHLANANKFGHIQRVNAMLGLKMPFLATPNQLLKEYDESA